MLTTRKKKTYAVIWSLQRENVFDFYWLCRRERDPGKHAVDFPKTNFLKNISSAHADFLVYFVGTPLRVLKFNYKVVLSISV